MGWRGRCETRRFCGLSVGTCGSEDAKTWNSVASLGGKLRPIHLSPPPKTLSPYLTQPATKEEGRPFPSRTPNYSHYLTRTAKYQGTPFHLAQFGTKCRPLPSEVRAYLDSGRV
jgi:hypothetical protein